MYIPQSSLIAFQTLTVKFTNLLPHADIRPQLSISQGYNKAITSHGSQLHQLHTITSSRLQGAHYQSYRVGGFHGTGQLTSRTIVQRLLHSFLLVADDFHELLATVPLEGFLRALPHG